MRASAALAGLAFVFAGSVAGAAQAQDSILDASGEETAPASRWTWFGDLLARYDHVEGLPNDRTVSRWRGRGRLGGEFVAMPQLSFGAAIELAQGSDDNADNRINNDNERSDHANIDQLWLRWQPGENTRVLLGKAAFPLELSPLTWDADLRPAGVSIDQSFALGDYSRLQLVAGGFAEVANDKLTVLAEEATPVSKLDRAKVEQALKDAREDFDDAKDDHAKAKANAQVEKYTAMLEAAA